MSYVVLARKWRPMTFSDLIGQGHVATTLGNAIAQNRVAHAFLFTGVRGVGKTTSARILAKALNCLSNSGPTAEPCLNCSACKEITAGNDVDVQEIDGASYNGVDEVRRLQESLPYRPARDRFKIFIIDEVHMLSTSAWNAFLKTLEEPPPHVKFIFATTEVHKVPITILSRVQRFDFKMIPSRLIVERLRYVLEQERIQADDDALSIIARQAAGSMRDAMSLLDQVIAWNDAKLTGDGVAAVLGVASRKVLYDLAQALFEGDANRLLQIIDALANQGFELGHVARDFLGLLRDIIVAAHADPTSSILDVPADEQGDIQALAKLSTDDWLRLYQAFSRGYDDILRGDHPRAALEMLLVRLARRPALIPVDDLIQRLIRLEKRIASGRPPTEAPPGAGGRPGRPGPPPTAQGSRSSQASGVAPVVAGAPNLALPPSAPETASLASSKPGSVTSPAVAPVAAASASAAPAASTTVNLTTATPAPVRARAAAAESSQPQREAAAESSPATVPPPAAGRNASHWQALSEVERWRKIVDALRVRDAKLGAFLDHARVHSVTPERVHISFEKNSVFEGALEDKETRAALAASAADFLGKAPELCLEHLATESTVTVFEMDRQARLSRDKELVERARQHPAVQEAVRVLGARVKHIEIPEA